jgi:hypothetical protein
MAITGRGAIEPHRLRLEHREGRRARDFLVLRGMRAAQGKKISSPALRDAIAARRPNEPIGGREKCAHER